MLAQLKSQGRQLLPWLSYLSHEIQALSSPAARARRRDEIAFIQNLGLTYDPDAGPVPAPSSESPCILFLSIGVVALSVVERLIAAAFERAGYRVVMILARDFRLRQAYRELGLSSCTAWQDFRPAPEAGLRMAAEALAGIATMEDLLALRREGVQAGKFALATTIRHLRCIDLDFSDGATRQVLVDQLGHSFTAIDGARRLLDRFRPAGVIMVDRGYTPNGEISESCTARGIPVYTYNFVHRSNLILMKRFGPHNQDQHHHSLSAPTWQAMQGIPWTERRFRQLIDEIDGAYRSGDWYSEVGTQRDTRLVARAELIDRLGLEPGRKVVGLFPHIFWDATFFWGRDLFRDYRDWFCQTLQAACANDRFSWVIKVHPANRVKSRRDGHQGEHSEITAIREAIGTLPAHIKVLGAGTDISSLSLFEILDYCLTVRGTVGIEAAMRGITVLTAGTGRYDRHGFTRDFDDREAYLAAVTDLETVSPITPAEVERARRFAYGTFLVRPTPLRSVDYGYSPDADCSIRTSLKVRNRDQLMAAPDVAALAAWIASGDDDFCHWPEAV